MPDPINVEQVKQLTTNYYTAAPQQVQAPPHQVQAPPQPAHQVPGNEQVQRAPVLRNAVQLPNNYILNEPTEDDLTQTYAQLGINLEDKQRRDLLADGRKKFGKQGDLVRKAGQQAAQRPRLREVTLKEAVKLSDSDLIKNFGAYTGANDYLFLRYSLISNRYYAILPKDASFKLTREELITKLAKLYQADNRNAELITFYENLVRLKDVEETLKEKPAAELIPNANAITEEERRKNQTAYDKNVTVINDSEIGDVEKQARIDLMRRVMLPGNDPDETFLQPTTVPINDEQKEGIRQILAWMYRNCCKSSESKAGFVHKLASSAPEKILLALYLVEKGKTAPAGDEFYEATHGYVPNLDAFKGKLIASKFKFWKRIGKDSSDDVINWSVLGSAVRYATQSGGAMDPSDVENYATYSGRMAQTQADMEHDEPNSVERRNHLVELIQHKGNLIRTYYRSAGLNTDMPVDMIGNKSMRAEVKSLIQGIAQDIQTIYDITNQLPDIAYGNVGEEKKEGVKEGESPSAIIGALGKVAKPISVLLAADTGVGLSANFSSAVGDFMKVAGYDVPTTSLKGLSGLLGLVFAISAIVGVAGSSSGLSTADHIAQGMQVGAGFVNSLGGGVSTATTIAGKFTDIGSVTKDLPWYGSLEFRTAGEAYKTVAGGVQYTAGCVAFVAGAVMTVAGGIQLGRVRSSKNDLTRAETAMNAKQHHNEKDAQLQAFMNHERRALSDQKSSALLQTFSGVLTMAGGFLTATGILAPLGGVLGLIGTGVGLGVGMYQARHKKNKTIKATVDEALNITDANVRAVKASNANLARKSNDTVRTMMRQEALSKLGYATYKECFADKMKEHALLLYDQVMNHQGDEDWAMYNDALKSLGMKIDVRNKIPTASAIYARLMK